MRHVKPDADTIAPVFQSSNGWTWEPWKDCTLVFDEEGDPVMSLPPFLPTAELCAIIIKAHEIAYELGKKVGHGRGLEQQRLAIIDALGLRHVAYAREGE